MRPLLLLGCVAVHGNHFPTFQLPPSEACAEMANILKAFRGCPVGGAMPGNAVGSTAIDNDGHVFGVFKVGFQAGFIIKGNGTGNMPAGVSFRTVGINQQNLTCRQLLSQFLISHIRILLLIFGQCGDGVVFTVRAGFVVICCCTFAV